MEITEFKNISFEQDTVRSVKSTKLVPARRINSDEGVIIPREAVSMTPLEPAKIIQPQINSNEPCYCCYLLIPMTIIAVFFAVKYFMVRKKR